MGGRGNFLLKISLKLGENDLSTDGRIQMNDNKICIVGNARPPRDAPIANKFVYFFITFIVDGDTGKILDLEASTILKLTNDFIRELFVGKSLDQLDEDLLSDIKHRYMGSCQKAIQVSYKDAVTRYNLWKENSEG